MNNDPNTTPIITKHILITGGSGLLGKELTTVLLQRGYHVSHLSRRPGNSLKVKTYLWNIDKGTIDANCIKGVDVVVHLAGEGIAEKRWTEQRKKELIESRTKSIGLIYHLLKGTQHQVKSVVSASGIGYYGDSGDELMTEDSPASADFIGECCVKWEQAVDYGAALGLRILKFRTGVVLTNKGGALPKLAMPIKLGFGAALGSGKQWMPWIHLQDVVDMYLMGIETETLSGVYNMVAPNPVTNKQLTIAVAKQLKRPLWLPNVPDLALKLALGEMSTVVLGSTKVSAAKIEVVGFTFKYPFIAEALKNV